MKTYKELLEKKKNLVTCPEGGVHQWKKTQNPKTGNYDDDHYKCSKCGINSWENK